jgi:hypothetical protein
MFGLVLGAPEAPVKVDESLAHAPLHFVSSGGQLDLVFFSVLEVEVMSGTGDKLLFAQEAEEGEEVELQKTLEEEPTAERAREDEAGGHGGSRFRNHW